jgi:DNA-binding CsgD family transcriptional regulator/tetratricopeptide (TPR) repeat protein
VLLERDIELGLADGFLDGVRAGHGRIMVFDGPPGIGKTALLSELSERATQRGVGMLKARASQLDQGFSFGIARQLLERRLLAAEPRERKALLGGAAQDALAALGIAGEPPDGDIGLRSLHGLYWLAANLAGRGPLVLCVDDAHWADRSSLGWLLYTAPRLVGLPLGIVMSTRSAEPGAEQDLLDGLKVDDSAEVLRLDSLSAAAVSVLVGKSLAGDAAPEFRAACHHSTGGNPLLVHELLRQLAAEGVLPTAEGAKQLEGFGVEAVARNVRRRLHRLGPLASRIARALAVLGDGATVVEVATLCECDEQAVRSAAVELTATDLLLRETPLAFVHPLVRGAVYEDMAAVERAALHRRVAGLRDPSGNPEQVAVHLLHVESRSDPQVVEVLRAAAAQATGRGAPDAAARFLRRGLAEPPEPRATRAAVLVELGRAEALARMEGFEEHLSEAIAELDDRQQAAEVALSLAGTLGVLGDGARAFQVLEEASATLRPDDGEMASVVEAELLATAQAYPEVRPRAAERVRGHLRRLDRGEPVDAVVQGALSLWLLREHPPAGRAVDAATLALADPRLTSQMLNTSVLPQAGYALLGAGLLARAGEVFDGVIDAAQRRGELPIMGVASMLRSETFYRQGEMVKAENSAQVSWGHAIGEGMVKGSSVVGLVFAGGMLVNALVARGKLDEAQSCVDRLPAALPLRSEMFLPARAELRLAQGRVDEALADLRATGELLGDDFAKPVQNWRCRLAVALASIDEYQTARALAAAELQQARRWQAPLAIGVALAASGIVQGATDGIALLEEAVATLEQTEGRLDHAVALIELGALLRRSGSRIAAREPLRLGTDLAARCGATAQADRGHAELVAAGARPRRDRRFLTGPESLTASEMRVATLAGEGLTDRAIAQRLYVTQATVQFHLRNTFRKLNIGARGELTAALDPAVGDAKA